MPEKEQETRCGFVVILGASNVGKSTLTNALVGDMVSIVNHKSQTTRMPVKGIAIAGQSQIIFVDTAGIFTPKATLDHTIVQAAFAQAKDADFILVMLDAKKGIKEFEEQIFAKLSSKTPFAIVLNKIDLIPKEKLFALTLAIQEILALRALAAKHYFFLCASNGNGVSDVLQKLASEMPLSPWHYSDDITTDQPLKTMAAEITREKIYAYVHEEIPYRCHVEPESFEEMRNGDLLIHQVIFASSQGMKKILVGNEGEKLKMIRFAAAKAISERFEKKIHLYLFVKIRPDWERKFGDLATRR